jgi:hypothetical protein
MLGMCLQQQMTQGWRPYQSNTVNEALTLIRPALAADKSDPLVLGVAGFVQTWLVGDHECGTHGRDKPARDMASTTGIASRRERSLSSAEASIRGASFSTLARNANVEVLFSGVLPETSVTFARRSFVDNGQAGPRARSASFDP